MSLARGLAGVIGTDSKNYDMSASFAIIFSFHNSNPE